MPVCAPVPAYDAATRARAAAELEALPEGAALVAMMLDYSVMRDQARACAAR